MHPPHNRWVNTLSASRVCCRFIVCLMPNALTCLMSKSLWMWIHINSHSSLTTTSLVFDIKVSLQNRNRADIGGFDVCSCILYAFIIFFKMTTRMSWLQIPSWGTAPAWTTRPQPWWRPSSWACGTAWTLVPPARWEAEWCLVMLSLCSVMGGVWLLS